MRCNQDPPVAGYKWQMNDIAASIGLANMHLLDERIKLAKRHARTYNKYFGITSDPIRESSYWLYTIYRKDVDHFIKWMKEKKVECSRVHDRNDTKTIFRESRCDLPNVDWFDKFHACIPVGWWVKEEGIQYIIKCLDEYDNR